MVSVKASLLVALAAVFSSAAAAHPRVHRTLRAQGTVNLIITLKDSTESVLESVKELEFATRGVRITSLVEKLQAHAKTSQASLHKLLDSSSALEVATTISTVSAPPPLFKSKTSFWISNQVREERIRPLPKPVVTSTNLSSNAEAVGVLANQWGVAKIGAPDVWVKGCTGQGVVVGVIDTGVLGTHTALKSKFRSSGYGWYDPYYLSTTPKDTDGHGTHVTGTIVGASGIGVAPDATWIACKGCEPDGCTDAGLLACAEFMTCPTDTAGESPDCSQAPDLVSNSWGGGQGDTFYQAAISAWRKIGIIPIFAIGNEGPACRTASSPGDSSNVIAVGSITNADGLSSFSNKGPSVKGLLKPDISAPGDQVQSTWNTGVNTYNTISGTSMATPHVSGVVALMLSANPGLTYDEVKTALQSSSWRLLAPTGYTCGATPDTVSSNNQYGSGRVSAIDAINYVLGVTPAPVPAPIPAPTPAPISKPWASDRCAGLSELFCDEFLCEWDGGSSTCSFYA